MSARLFVAAPPPAGRTLALPAAAARHVHVLRLQPGDTLALFDGSGREWPARIVAMTRQGVEVELGEPVVIDRELAVAVTLAVGMPANDRMDFLVEKAAELGVAALQPLLCERSVLRLAGERADKRVAHWLAVAIAACEQSGRTRVPRIAPVLALPAWLATLADDGNDNDGDGTARLLLSLAAAQPLPAAPRAVVALSGPEGGLTAAEEALARDRGFVPVSLGPRVLRADTAPLALLAHLGLR
jgi:16S rRNA (uracil1498-N3)-methyltransferase